MVCFDYDRDGDLDIGLVNHSVGSQFFENQVGVTSGHFFSMRLAGLPPNTEALGARVEVRADLDGDGAVETGETQVRVVAANSGFASQGPPDIHFGLGAATVIEELRVVWPDATSDLVCSAVAADRFALVSMADGDGQGTCP